MSEQSYEAIEEYIKKGRKRGRKSKITHFKRFRMYSRVCKGYDSRG